MGKLKKCLLLVVMLSCALLAVSCSNDTQAIKTVVTDFVTTYQNQQYSVCLDYTSNHVRTSTGDQALTNKLEVANLFLGTTEIKSITILTISRTRATVRVDMVGFANIKNSKQLTLIKESGHWKIDDF